LLATNGFERATKANRNECAIHTYEPLEGPNYTSPGFGVRGLGFGFEVKK